LENREGDGWMDGIQIDVREIGCEDRKLLNWLKMAACGEL